MSNKNIKIQIIASDGKYKKKDIQDEKRISIVIQKDVLPNAKVDYNSVNVEVKRAPDGSPKSLIAFMLRKETYTADVTKIDVDKDYNVKAIQNDYTDYNNI